MNMNRAHPCCTLKRHLFHIFIILILNASLAGYAFAYLDPGTFSSLGTFNPSSNVVVNMTTRSMTGGVTATGVMSGDILVFTFDSFSLGAGYSISFSNVADNDDKIAFLSKGDMTISGNIYANASGTAPGPGGRRGGTSQPEVGQGTGGGQVGLDAGDDDGAGGGGFGGAGGAHGYGAPGGTTYGDLATALDGGSGGARSAYSSDTSAGGGGGGGALELGALGTTTLNNGCNIEAKGAAGSNADLTPCGEDGDGGGSGGGILIHGNVVTFNSGANVNASGGNGGNGDNDSNCGQTSGTGAGGAGGGGGGGRIRIAYNGSGTNSGSAVAAKGTGGTDPGPYGSYPGGDGSAGVVQFVQDSNVPVTSSGPEISVYGNSVSINDGDTTPSVSDDTHFGDVDKDSGTATHTFTIKNTGPATLTISGGPNYVSVDNAVFSVTSQPSDVSLEQNETTTFSIQFDPDGIGIETANVSFANNDDNENPFNFVIEGNGTSAASLYLDGRDFTSLGSFNPSSDVTVNMSTGAMTGGLSATGTVSNGILVFTFDDFTLVSSRNINFTNTENSTNKIAFLSLSNMTLSGAINGSGSTYTPGPGGGAGGTAKPSDGTGAGGGGGSEDGAGGAGFGGAGGDSGNGVGGGSTYGDLAVSLSGGSGGARSEYSSTGNYGGGAGGAVQLGALGIITLNSGASINANGVAGPASTGVDADGDGGGSGGGILIHGKTIRHNSGATISANGGNGGGTAGAGDGIGGGGGGGGRVRLVYHTSGAGDIVQTGTITVSGGMGGADVTPGEAGASGTSAWASDANVPIGGPEINIKGNGVSIADGDTSPSTGDDTDFGSVDVTSGSDEHTFTIENLGAETLNLTDASPYVAITGHTADFTLTSTPSAAISDGSTTPFAITFDPTAGGTREATVSIANDDSDENPYNFDIRGTGTYTAPTTQAQTVTFPNIEATTMTIGWTNGNGTARVVFLYKGGSLETASPVDGTTYTANTAFGAGTQIGATGWYCVYNGTGTSVAVTGLMPGATYRAMVCEYNGDAGYESYVTDTATGNPTNQTMVTVMINEVDADTPGTDTLEFIELYDGGVGTVSLDGLVLVFYDGTDDQSYNAAPYANAIDLDGYSTDANGYFVIGNAGVSGVDMTFSDNALQNGADAVALYVGDGTDFPDNTPVTTVNLIDALVYDTDDADDAGLLTLVLAGGQINESGRGGSTGHSNQRIPNGTGGLRNTTAYTQQPPTPGAENNAYPEITSAAYDYGTNQLVVTGRYLVENDGADNDVDVSLLTVTGEGGGTYTLADSADVEITSDTQFTVTLSGADIPQVEALLNKDGTSADDDTVYNLAAADNWMPGAPAADDIADATNGITVSNYTVPMITSCTYDATSGQLVATGTNFVVNSGLANDVDTSLITFTGQGSGTYTLTDTGDVEITSSTQFTVTVSATDRPHVNGLLNRAGTQSADTVLYNLAAADNWMPGAPAGNDTADATSGITVSNVQAPTITEAAYDYGTDTLTVTGAAFVAQSGVANDVDITKLTVTGEGGGTYTLATSNNPEIASSTQFTVTLSGADIPHVESLLNKDGTSAADGPAYNLAAADNWMPGTDPSADIADGASGITVSGYAVPQITSAVYDAGTGQLVATGTNFVVNSGASDVDASQFTFTGQGSGTYTLTDTGDVEITSATQCTVTLSATDRSQVNGLLNRAGTQSADAVTYNLAAADNWMPGSPAGNDTADGTTGITVSNVQTPTITEATYDADTGVFTVTGTNLRGNAGAANDIDVSRLTVTGEGGNYTISDAIADVEITSSTEFTFTVTGTDKTQVDLRLDLFGTQSSGGTTYNLAAADNWLAAADPAADIADLTNNEITVTVNPRITSATYNAATGVLVVTGSNIRENGGGSDIDASQLTFTGEGDATYTLTDTPDVNRDSSSQFTVTLSAVDRAAVNRIMNKNGTASTGGTAYNLAAADDWCTNVTAGNTADPTGNGITVSNVPLPMVTSATYNAGTGVLVVTGTGLVKRDGAANDIDVSQLTVTGEGGETCTIQNTAGVEITSDTQFTVTLNETDRSAVNRILNKNGTSSTSGTTYNLAAAEDWAAGADPAVDVADEAGNGITVSGVTAPVITSASYQWSTGVLTVAGTGFLKKAGIANDIDASRLTFRGEGGVTYTLVGSADVDITSDTEFSVTLDATDKAAVNPLLNKAGTSSEDDTVYNLAGAEDWAAGADPAVNVADATTPITVGGFTVTISGTVTDGVNPIEGATITFSHDGHTEQTAADGTYSYVVSAGITTTVIPTHPGYATWDPANRTLTNVTTDQLGQDFTATSDTDGIPTTEENGPDGTDPAYDGNSDGIPDGNQPHVASFHTADGENYVTLAAPDGTLLSGVQALPAPDNGTFPHTTYFPYGLFRFTVTGVTPGGATVVQLFLSGETTIESYWRYGPEPGDPTMHAYEFMLDGGTGAEIAGHVVTLHFIDGRRGDDDLDGGNGVIVDDGGPTAATPVIPVLTKNGIVVFVVILSILACLVIRSRRQPA